MKAEEVFFSKMAAVFSVYQPNTKGLFNTFNKLHQSEAFSDLTIKCQSRTFKVHRAVLVAQSTYFYSLLLGDDGKESCSQIPDDALDNIDPDMLQLVLDYIYSGCLINFSEVNAKSLREAADKLEIREIVNKCKKVELLKTEPTTDNCLDGWSIAMEAKNDDLCAKFSQVALTHFTEVRNCPSFVESHLEIIKVYLSHSDLQVKSSDLILSAALNWVRADPTKRLSHLPVLLKSLPLHTMKVEVLEYVIQGEPMFRQHSEARSTLQDAISSLSLVGLPSPVCPPSPVSPPSRVAVEWYNSKTIKLYDATLREEVGSIDAPPDVSNIGDTGCCLTGHYLFVCGENKLLSYNMQSKQWKVRGELSHHRVRPALISVDNKVFILGGRRHTKDETAVTAVEIWRRRDHNRLLTGGKLVGDKCYGASCCQMSDHDDEVAVWGMRDADGLILQIYSIEKNITTHSVRVKSTPWWGRGVVCVADHVIMCNSINKTFRCRICDLRSNDSDSVTKLNNFKPLRGYNNALIVSEDGKKITALWDGQLVMTADVKDVISDAASGWSLVDVKWIQNKDEWCNPSAVCTSYRPK